MEKQIKCHECKQSGKNLFKGPYDVTDISIFHSKRSEKEYYFRCSPLRRHYNFYI